MKRKQEIVDKILTNSAMTLFMGVALWLFCNVAGWLLQIAGC